MHLNKRNFWMVSLAGVKLNKDKNTATLENFCYILKNILAQVFNTYENIFDEKTKHFYIFEATA